MIEVFKTNVTKVSEAKKLILLLKQFLPDSMISFDLKDCDKILRIDACCEATVLKVVALVQENGYQCYALV